MDTYNGYLINPFTYSLAPFFPVKRAPPRLTELYIYNLFQLFYQSYLIFTLGEIFTPKGPFFTAAPFPQIEIF